MRRLHDRLAALEERQRRRVAAARQDRERTDALIATKQREIDNLRAALTESTGTTLAPVR